MISASTRSVTPVQSFGSDIMERQKSRLRRNLDKYLKRMREHDFQDMLGPCMIKFSVPLFVPGIMISFVPLSDQTGFRKYSPMHVIGMLFLAIPSLMLLVGIVLTCKARFRTRVYPGSATSEMCTVSYRTAVGSLVSLPVCNDPDRTSEHQEVSKRFVYASNSQLQSSAQQQLSNRLLQSPVRPESPASQDNSSTYEKVGDAEPPQIPHFHADSSSAALLASLHPLQKSESNLSTLGTSFAPLEVNSLLDETGTIQRSGLQMTTKDSRDNGLKIIHAKKVVEDAKATSLDMKTSSESSVLSYQSSGAIAPAALRWIASTSSLSSSSESLYSSQKKFKRDHSDEFTRAATQEPCSTHPHLVYIEFPERYVGHIVAAPSAQPEVLTHSLKIRRQETSSAPCVRGSKSLVVKESETCLPASLTENDFSKKINQPNHGSKPKSWSMSNKLQGLEYGTGENTTQVQRDNSIAASKEHSAKSILRAITESPSSLQVDNGRQIVGFDPFNDDIQLTCPGKKRLQESHVNTYIQTKSEINIPGFIQKLSQARPGKDLTDYMRAHDFKGAKWREPAEENAGDRGAVSPTNKLPTHSVYMPSSSVAKITLRNPSPQNYIQNPAVYLYTMDDLADSIVPAHAKEISPKHKVKVKLNAIKDVDCGKDPQMTFKPKTNIQRCRVSSFGNPGSGLSPSYPNADIMHLVTPYGQDEKIIGFYSTKQPRQSCSEVYLPYQNASLQSSSPVPLKKPQFAIGRWTAASSEYVTLTSGTQAKNVTMYSNPNRVRPDSQTFFEAPKDCRIPNTRHDKHKMHNRGDYGTDIKPVKKIKSRKNREKKTV